MLELSGYTIDKCVQATLRSRIYTGLRNSDETPVALKLYAQDEQRFTSSLAQAEFDLLDRIRGPGVVSAIEVAHSERHPVLVTELLDGPELGAFVRAGLPSFSQFLELALGLSRALARVHALHLIHRDLKPSNIVITHAAGVETPQLIDFGLARPLGTLQNTGQIRRRTDLFNGTLEFMAPEQSGRMSRGADLRSDLYALGAIFYFMLTGVPPFESRDPLELIHCHLARIPAVPSVHRPEIPGPLSMLVMKLLSKEPQDRYASVEAIASDLELCRSHMNADGHIHAPIEIGRANLPERPRFPTELVGRACEIARLEQAYQHAREAASRLVLISGEPGSGKSSLLGALRKRISGDHGYLIRAKFDQYECNAPYEGFSQAFRELCDQWLTESPERLSELGRRLRDALGAIGSVMTEMIPDLSLIIGEMPPLPPLGPRESQARIALAVRRFVHGCATRERPLVIGLDDVQWADSGSVHLLETLHLDDASRHLLFICTRRSVASSSSPFDRAFARMQKAEARIERLELAPLAIEAVEELLAATLERDPGDVCALARSIERKTGNTPLLVEHFIDWIHQRDLLHYVRGIGWTWDVDAVESLQIPDSAVAMVSQRIAQLDAPTQSVLGFVSCIGDRFDLESVAAIWERDGRQLEAGLYRVLDAGLITTCPEGFRFAHDRIREAAQALLQESARSQVHHRTGFALLERTSADELPERALEIADHLNRARSMLDPEQDVEAARINLVAAKQALRSGAADTAGRYLEQARSLLGLQSFATQPALCFDVWLTSIDSGIQTRDFSEVRIRIEELERRTRDRAEAGGVASRRVQWLALTQPPSDAVRATLEILERFGIHWMQRPPLWRVFTAIARTEIALLSWRWRARRSSASTGRRGDPGVPNDEVVAILSAAAHIIAVDSRRLAVISMGWRVRRSLRTGSRETAGRELIAYAAYRFGFLHDRRWLQRDTELGWEWSLRYEDASWNLRSRYVLAALVHPWIRPRVEAVAPLLEIADCAADLGDVELEQLARAGSSLTRLLSGIPLDEVYGDLEQRQTPTAESGRRLVNLLRSPKLDSESLDSECEHFMSLPPHVIHNALLIALLTLYVLGRADTAREILERAIANAPEQLARGYYAADTTLFRGLLLAATCPQTRSRDRATAIRRLEQLERRMRVWARGSADFQHMLLLLKAERLILARRHRSALAALEAAAHWAQERGYVHHAAIACERQAALLTRLARHAQAMQATRNAARHYEAWGAHAKVQRLLPQSSRDA